MPGLHNPRWWEKKPRHTLGRGTQAALREAFGAMGVARVRRAITAAAGHNWQTCFVGAAYPEALVVLPDDSAVPAWESGSFVDAFADASGLHPMQIRLVAEHFDQDEVGFLQFAAQWVAEQDRVGQVEPVYAEAAV